MTDHLDTGAVERAIGMCGLHGLHGTQQLLRALAAEVERLTKERDRLRKSRDDDGQQIMALQATVAAIPAQIAAARVEMRDRCAQIADQYREAWPRATAPNADPVLKHEYASMAKAAGIIFDQIEALPIPGTDALEMAECAAHSAGYEAGELDGFNAGIEAVAGVIAARKTIYAAKASQSFERDDDDMGESFLKYRHAVESMAWLENETSALKRSGKGAEG